MTRPSRFKPPTGGRLASVVAGGLLALFASLVLLAAGGLQWAESKKDDDGYLSTKRERLVTNTYAIATDDLDIDSGVPGAVVDHDRYGDLRLQVRSNNDTPVFVGIARTKAVDSYLGGTGHATLTDVDFDPFEASYRTHGGSRPAAPATQDFWAASAQGTGTQTVKWDVEHGSWSVVVMNADGSRGVDAGVSAGANLPILGDLAWGTTILAAVLFVAAGGLILGGLLRPRATPRRQPSAPAESASAA